MHSMSEQYQRVSFVIYCQGRCSSARNEKSSSTSLPTFAIIFSVKIYGSFIVDGGEMKKKYKNQLLLISPLSNLCLTLVSSPFNRTGCAFCLRCGIFSSLLKIMLETTCVFEWFNFWNCPNFTPRKYICATSRKIMFHGLE